MAHKLEVVLVDDLDGSEAKETVTFGLDARFYEIDLSDDHAKELRETLKKYIQKGRTTAPPSPQNEARQRYLLRTCDDRDRIHDHPRRGPLNTVLQP